MPRVEAMILALAIALAAAAAARADILIATIGPMSVTPMSGQYAAFGEELQRGTGLAVRDVNARGGVNGESFRLLLADDACDPELAVKVAEELVR